jgi:hypothetical protein
MSSNLPAHDTEDESTLRQRHPNHSGNVATSPPSDADNVGAGRYTPGDSKMEEYGAQDTPYKSSDVEKSAVPVTSYGEGVFDEHYDRPAETAEDLVTEVIHVRDNPSLNPWTFRTWFIGKWQPMCLKKNVELISSRNWTFDFWRHFIHNLLFQATTSPYICRFPWGDKFRSW